MGLKILFILIFFQCQNMSISLAIVLVGGVGYENRKITTSTIYV